jgi:hypothetical protein
MGKEAERHIEIRRFEPEALADQTARNQLAGFDLIAPDPASGVLWLLLQNDMIRQWCISSEAPKAGSGGNKSAARQRRRLSGFLSLNLLFDNRIG